MLSYFAGIVDVQIYLWTNLYVGIEEAEAQRALLNSESLCDGCFSSDSDIFLFGARTVYREICLDLGNLIYWVDIFHSTALSSQKDSRSKDHSAFKIIACRQMGFKDRRIGPDICRLASEYISKYEGFEDDIYAYFENEPDADSLYVKLVEEFERCILSYFGFHWNHCDILISQVLSSDISEPKKKLKNIVMAATRDQRFERVAKSLKVASVFNTLVEEMKAMGIAVNDDSQCAEVMAPVAHSDRSPVLLLMGGGMGAGKSTVLKYILKEPFWAGASGNAVVIKQTPSKNQMSSTGHFAQQVIMT
ncbi:hypothetical protein RYX36_002721 [Vicia faba]